MQEIDHLFTQLQQVEPYPSGVQKIQSRIAGTAFFPGGDGLWKEGLGNTLPKFPKGGTMVLGHDFGNEHAHQRALEGRKENLKGPTWRIVQDLLQSASISLDSCFFTNFYMGLRPGSSPITGRFPGAVCPSYVDRCREFLKFQIGLQRPRLILTLGAHVPRLLAGLAEDLAAWKSCSTLKKLDSEATPLLHKVLFSTAEPVECTVIALTHPSMWHCNVGRRRFESSSGSKAELQMLRSGVSQSSSS